MVDCEQRALIELPVIQVFLLVQKGKVLDVCRDPIHLGYSILDDFLDFQVYVGVRNEFGKKEIAGPIAKVWVANSYGKYTLNIKCGHTYNAQSTMTATEAPCEVVARQLKHLYNANLLNDPASLPQVHLFAT
jgi:hypothetical protein